MRKEERAVCTAATVQTARPPFEARTATSEETRGIGNEKRLSRQFKPEHGG